MSRLAQAPCRIRNRPFKFPIPLVYVGPGESGGGLQLWIRRWADLDATPIRGTEGAALFALSPDGRKVAFSAFPGPLRVVALDGGPSRTLVESVMVVDDWAPDGTVYFSQGGVGGQGLGRVPASGGGSEVVEIFTEALEGESTHTFFTVLPGGKMGVFEVLRAFTGEDAEVWAIDLETRERKLLTPGHTPAYASTGHLLFATPDGVLMAAPIDPGTAELTGPSVPVAEGLAILTPFGTANYAVSESGTLIYMAGGVAVGGGGIIGPVWVTRSGNAVPVDPGWRFNVLGQDFALRQGWSVRDVRQERVGELRRLAEAYGWHGSAGVGARRRAQLTSGPVEPRWRVDGFPHRWRGWARAHGRGRHRGLQAGRGQRSDTVGCDGRVRGARPGSVPGRPLAGVHVRRDGSERSLRQTLPPGFLVVQRETLFALATGSIATQSTGLRAGAGRSLYDIAPDDQRFLMLRLALTSTSGAGETRFILVQNFFEELTAWVGN